MPNLTNPTRLISGCLLLVAIVGCERPDSETPAAKTQADTVARPTIYTVNYPLQYMAARIAGDAADVVFPAPPDEDPAYWRPTPETIAAYQQADLILRNGASYAKWAAHATLPASKMVNTSRAFPDRLIALQGTTRHIHGPEGEHTHGELAFTTWLDPTLAAKHAAAIRAALIDQLPSATAQLEENFESLQSDLAALDRRFDEMTAGHHDRPLLASHPVYQYFARRYKLNLHSLHWEPDQSPTAEQWRALDELLAEHPAKWMLWEAPPTAECVAELEKRGITCVVFYPAGNRPSDADYLQTMTHNADRLQPAFE